MFCLFISPTPQTLETIDLFIVPIVLNRELPDVQAGFRKGRGTRDQIVNICWIMEKAREFQKSIYFCFIDTSLPPEALVPRKQSPQILHQNLLF